MSEIQSASDIERTYNESVRQMSTVEKVARSFAMFEWTRDQIARQILAVRGPTETELLKLLVAQRLYGNEQQARELIEQRLEDLVSD